MVAPGVYVRLFLNGRPIEPQASAPFAADVAPLSEPVEVDDTGSPIGLLLLLTKSHYARSQTAGSPMGLLLLLTHSV